VKAAKLVFMLIAVLIATMNNQPASKMIRVPTPLVSYVNELSRIYRQGKAKPLFHQLQKLISALDSTSDTQYNTPGTSIDSSLITELVQSVKHIESILEQTASTTASKHAIIKTDSSEAENSSPDTPADSSADSNSQKQIGLTVAELAKVLGISKRQVYRLRQVNQLTGWKTVSGEGKTLRYIPADEG
jgi:excisionase family DNA binding protein